MIHEFCAMDGPSWGWGISPSGHVLEKPADPGPAPLQQPLAAPTGHMEAREDEIPLNSS